MSDDTDLLGTPLTEAERSLLTAYDDLHALLASDLAPCAASGVRAALAHLGVVVTDLGLRYDHLLDDGV
ncbi:hypothetical protein PHK61_11845 [Actinomycetospora lutea]|uniref:hypothetical protein n=1 Tax=Actinomycetospora lutea TaxID=663604 RepID=UPI00236564F3|nr:hypothetical protein [Actinomycetospora lutea]MDD7939107.1 hypothetical protein [Actinomycetospora lutea]